MISERICQIKVRNMAIKYNIIVYDSKQISLNGKKMSS